MKEPLITVGILSGKEIEFSFPETFVSSDKIESAGDQKAVYKEGKIYWEGNLYDEISFSPQLSNSAFFELKNVTIGINFHWERKEPQRFKGTLKLIIEEKKLTAINIIPIEDYLTSVISSEMSATASLELLKAHAVISRSWLLNKIEERENEKLRMKNEKLKVRNDKVFQMKTDSAAHSSYPIPHSSFIKWYDHEAHTHFDVCADDHCQRYQGITRTSTSEVTEAVFSTRGEVLMFENHICDARFSKCCGGV